MRTRIFRFSEKLKKARIIAVLLGFVFAKSLRQLIRARRIVAALDAGKRSDYFVDGFTDAKSLDALQIARAAADEFQVCQNVVVDRKNYFS